MAVLGHLFERHDGHLVAHSPDEVADLRERFEFERESAFRIEFPVTARYRSEVGDGRREHDGVGTGIFRGAEHGVDVVLEERRGLEREAALRTGLFEFGDAFDGRFVESFAPSFGREVSHVGEGGGLVAHVSDGVSGFDRVFGDVGPGASAGDIGYDAYVVDGDAGSSGGDGEMHMRYG